ncbi:conserved membrane protein of unknown function [Nitrospira sp. KM1]|uniref:hypothetical protein n=1 Tax=Nitrospira sp. KM1 TaxID=1936990 RepID=UPI0013A73DC7|nr:hypothetical protein [Nitrospira sp. KM1]BCA57043.1 conserved membrane protein of unknown function [Nitrospira sp. KM1]
MTMECPRCLATNPDTCLVCECGYDLLHKRTSLPSSFSHRHAESDRDYGMSKEAFAVGIIVVLALLTFGEWMRIGPELTTRKPFDLIVDSLLLSMTDMIGALIIGALGWMVVWIILAYEGRRLRPCPKRTTLAVTVVAAGLLFISRWIAPDIQTQHIVHAVVILGIAVFAYYAGCRHWLGKW